MPLLATLSSFYHTMVLALLILGLINGNSAQDDWTTLPDPLTSTTFTAPPQTTPTSSDDGSLLSNCAHYLCSWIAQSNFGIQSYSFIVGSPVSNCYGGTYPVDSEFRVSFTTSDTWSTGLNVGVQIGQLAVGYHDSWSSTKSQTFSQNVVMHVPPNQQGAVIALMNYNVTSGNMTVGSTVVSPVYANQPMGQVEWGVNMIDCDRTFDANTTSPYPASSGGLRTPVLSSIFYASVILAGMGHFLMDL